MWKSFLEKKFSATEAEQLRRQFEELSDSEYVEADLTRKEFEDTGRSQMHEP